MSSNSSFLIVLLATAGTTFFLLAAPVLIPRRRLASPLLQALNRFLPLFVMVILLANTFTRLEEPLLTPFAAQLLALVIVLLSYIRFKHVLLSMILGVGSLNALLYVFGA